MKKVYYIIILIIAIFNTSAFGQIVLYGSDASGTFIAPDSIVLRYGFNTATGKNFQAIINNSPVLTPSLDHNFIHTFTVRQAGITNPEDTNLPAAAVSSEVQYFDEMGRPLQTVGVKATANQNDMIQPHVYDFAGREAVKYDPYTSMLNAPGVHAAFHEFAVDEAMYFYRSIDQPNTGMAYNDYPYAKSKIENSVSPRVLEQGEQGMAWQLTGDNFYAGHTTKTEYNSGATDVALYSVKIDQTTGVRSLFRTGNNENYSPYSKIWVTTIKDQNWKDGDGDDGVVREYRDLNDRLILKRQYVKEGAVITKYSTYYVYDDFGNLSYVLTPKAEPDYNIMTPALLNDLCYQYIYDGRNRLTEKKLPGKDWEYTIYNKLDQIIMTQDGRQRAITANKTKQEWGVIKYDGQGRVILTGIYTDAASTDNANRRQILQNAADAVTAQWEKRLIPATGNGYTATTYPTSWTTTLTLNYYDNYDLPGGNPYPFAGDIGITRSLLTASKVNILGTSNMLWAINYYDKQGRIFKNKKQHYKGGIISAGNYDDITTTYDFIGQSLTSTKVQNINNISVLNTLLENEYDHTSKITNIWETINGGTRTLLSRFKYTDLGHLWIEKFHSVNSGVTFLDSISNYYTFRNWPYLTYSSKHNLSYSYDQATNPQYNGNISGKGYSTYSKYSGKFFTYDKLNRLTNADGSSSNLNETVAYDKNGNITSLTRGAVTYGPLTYTYKNSGNSNQLATVTTSTGSGFTARNYNYDENGNALSDGGAKNITYNLLNLPSTIKTGATLNADYTYTATGEKLSSTEYKPGGGTILTEYIDGVVYQDGAINFVQTPKGKATPNGTPTATTPYNYVYDLKDNQGNVMTSVTSVSGVETVLQEDAYYAFGLRVPVLNNNNNNRYLYNGKEEQTALQLDKQDDYGARFYDPVIARWTTVDPLAEQSRRWSPYNYGEDNPIRNIDPDGMSTESWMNTFNLSDKDLTTVYQADDDWYTDIDGKAVWDPSVTDKKKAEAKGGIYIGKTFLATNRRGSTLFGDQNGQLWSTVLMGEIRITSNSYDPEDSYKDQLTTGATTGLGGVYTAEKYLSRAGNFAAEDSKLLADAVPLGVGVGLYSLWRDGNKLYNNGSLGNKLRFGWDLVITGVSLAVPEVGLADGLFDSSGYKSKMFDAVDRWDDKRLSQDVIDEFKVN